MAMTKAERAELEKARADLAAAKALSWPSYPMPALTPAPSPGARFGEFTTGWSFNAYGAMPDPGRSEVGRAVQPMWSEAVRHGDGHVPRANGSASQNGKALYASKADAYRALRIEATERAARILAKIDALIAEAEDAERTEAPKTGEAA